MAKFKSPFIILTCAVEPKSTVPVRVVASVVTAIYSNSSGSDVWDLSGHAHSVKETPEEVEAMVTEKLGLLGLVPPIIPMREVPE